jgi:hypothetical protein
MTACVVVRTKAEIAIPIPTALNAVAIKAAICHSAEPVTDLLPNWMQTYRSNAWVMVAKLQKVSFANT